MALQLKPPTLMIKPELLPREKIVWDSITTEQKDVIEYYVEMYTEEWPDRELHEILYDRDATLFLLEEQIPIWNTLTHEQVDVFITVVITFINLNFEEMRRVWTEDEIYNIGYGYTTFAVKLVFFQMKSKLNFKFLNTN